MPPYNTNAPPYKRRGICCGMSAAAVVTAVRHIVPKAAIVAAAMARTAAMYPDDDDGDDHHDPESLAAVKEEPSAIVAASAVTVVVATHKKLPPKKNSHSRVFRSPLKCSGFFGLVLFLSAVHLSAASQYHSMPASPVGYWSSCPFFCGRKRKRACHTASPPRKMNMAKTQSIFTSSYSLVPMPSFSA